MSIVWQHCEGESCYQVRRAGGSLRLYTNGVLHSQYNAQRPLTGSVWDLLLLPAFFYAPGAIRRVLVLGVGGGAVIRQLRHFVQPRQIIGVDLSGIHLTIAERFFGVTGPDVQLVRADAARWLRDYAGEPFDMIIDDLFADTDGEPVRAVAAHRQWASLLLDHLAADGVVVSNFPGRADLRYSAWLQDRRVRAVLRAAFELGNARNHNAVGVFLRRPATTRQLRRRLVAHPELDPRRKRSPLQYRIRTLLR
jgi:spermidine synthase